MSSYGYHYPPKYYFSDGGVEAKEKAELEAEDKEEDAILTVFPNPAKDFVIFSVELGEGQSVSNLEVRDLNGRLIYSKTGIVGNSRIEWQTEGVPSGIYFYKLVSNSGEAQSGKVILNK